MGLGFAIVASKAGEMGDKFGVVSRKAEFSAEPAHRVRFPSAPLGADKIAAIVGCGVRGYFEHVLGFLSSREGAREQPRRALQRPAGVLFFGR
jgi:hypothetical protein